MCGLVSVRIEALTDEAFAPFGEILQPRRVPTYDLPFKAVHRFPWETDAPTVVQILTFKPQPLFVTKVERHLHVTETRMHISGPPTVIVVGEPGLTSPEPSQFRAFLLNSQGVMFRKGVWHAVDAFPLGIEPSQFLFLSDSYTQNEIFDNPITVPLRSDYRNLEADGLSFSLRLS